MRAEQLAQPGVLVGRERARDLDEIAVLGGHAAQPRQRTLQGFGDACESGYGMGEAAAQVQDLGHVAGEGAEKSEL